MSASFSLDLWDVPAGQPPPGKVSNLTDPPSQAPILSTGIYVLLPLVVPFVIMRLYTRLRLNRAFAIDDFLSVISFFLILAYAGVLLGLLNLKPITPLGRHMWDIPVAAFTGEYSALIIMCLVTNPAAAMFVKLAILTFYFRIFKPSRWANHTILAGSIIVAVFYLVTIITLLALCVPSRGETWFYKVSSGTCSTAQVGIARSQGFFGLFSDVFILVIPLWQVSQLSLAPKRKMGVMLVFFTGLLAIGSSAAGLALREQVSLADPNWLTTPYLFGLCEVTIGLICSCMPVITILLKSLAAQTVSSWRSIKNYYSQTPLSRRQVGPSATQLEAGKEPSDLPQIPGGTLSGLRTLFRKFDRTTIRSAPETDNDSLELDSFDQDYHEQLRIMYSSHANAHTPDRKAPQSHDSAV